nr:carboxypeptidase-like regulatory domain-containing protein [Catalimonadaceae bacterium]
MPFKQLIPAFCLVLHLFIQHTAQSQTLKGQVQNEQNQPLKGASVQWAGTSTGTTTGPDGQFEIPFSPETSQSLIIRFAGYKSDTVRVLSAEFLRIQLSPSSKNLSDVTIVKDRAGSFVSGSTTEKSEVITQKEMTKAACCDMAGCFETQATVQPQTTNVLTNSKELRILGLSGVYNQVLIDGLPMIQATTFTYGISSYPAAIIDKIYVAKGANSVLQGFESISGQINVITRDPEKEPILYANAYLNNFGEKHFNLNYGSLVGEEGKWKTLVGLHHVLPAGKRDRDGDGFLDLPLLSRSMVFNKWNYGKDTEEGWFTQLSFRLTKESRMGGQRSFNPDTDKGTTRAYGQTLDYLQPEFISKTGYRFNETHALLSNISAFGQEQESYFGTLHYKANQQSLNVSIHHQWNYSETNILNTGVSYRGQKLRETIHFTDTLPLRTYGDTYSTDLSAPGLFAEHTAI